MIWAHGLSPVSLPPPRPPPPRKKKKRPFISFAPPLFPGHKNTLKKRRKKEKEEVQWWVLLRSCHGMHGYKPKGVTPVRCVSFCLSRLETLIPLSPTSLMLLPCSATHESVVVLLPLISGTQSAALCCVFLLLGVCFGGRLLLLQRTRGYTTSSLGVFTWKWCSKPQSKIFEEESGVPVLVLTREERIFRTRIRRTGKWVQVQRSGWMWKCGRTRVLALQPWRLVAIESLSHTLPGTQYPSKTVALFLVFFWHFSDQISFAVVESYEAGCWRFSFFLCWIFQYPAYVFGKTIGYIEVLLSVHTPVLTFPESQ